jgi:hypothetical protein
MSENLFNTPSEEVSHLVTEIRDMRDILRELSSKLTRIETRLKRAFPVAYPKKSEKAAKTVADQDPATLNPEQAMALYEELVRSSRKEEFEEVRNKLSSLNIADLALLRRELGISLGKRKPSQKTLMEAIQGRIKESVMLSKHSNRQEILDRPKDTKDSTNNEGKE